MFAHELVVGALHAMLSTHLRAVVEAAEVREGLASPVVVIDHQHVVMCFASPAVRVRDDETVGVRVHPLCELVTHVVHALDVRRILRVELGVGEGLPIMKALNLALRVLCQSTRTRHECTGPTWHVAGDSHTALVSLAPHIRLRVRSIPARAVVSGAHEATRSPSRVRTSRRSRMSSGTSADRTTD